MINLWTNSPGDAYLGGGISKRCTSTGRHQDEVLTVQVDNQRRDQGLESELGVESSDKHESDIERE